MSRPVLKAGDPEHLFDWSQPGLREVNDVIRQARAGSSPGPNGIPYKVYKNYPNVDQTDVETSESYKKKRTFDIQLAPNENMLWIRSLWSSS